MKGDEFTIHWFDNQDDENSLTLRYSHIENVNSSWHQCQWILVDRWFPIWNLNQTQVNEKMNGLSF